MWYAADKYVRLLERDIKERGLIETPKKDSRKQSAENPKKKETLGVKRPVKTESEEKSEEISSPAKKDAAAEDASGTPSRRRSSRVAKNEEIARQTQENKEKEKVVVQKEEESEGDNRKKRTPKKAKHSEEMNGQHHEENDENENSPEVKEEEKTPWSAVYLTRFEMDGLYKLMQKLRTWPLAIKNVPEKVQDPDKILERLEVCVTWASPFIKLSLIR